MPDPAVAECPICGNTFHDLTDMLIEGGVLKVG